MYEDLITKVRDFSFLIIRKDLSVNDGYFRKNFGKPIDPHDYDK